MALTSRDVRAVLALVGELGELIDAPPYEAREHLMTRAGGLCGARSVWWSLVGGSPTRPGDVDAAVIMASQVHGIDAGALQRWQRDFVELGGHRAQPLWRRFFERSGEPRSACRRDLIEDRVWYNDAHFWELSRPLGNDDVVAAAAPLGQGRELWLAAARHLGDRAFSAREREILALITAHTAWLARRHAAPIRDGDQRAVRDRLAPRHRAVLDLLLDGLGEKGIAAATRLSPRTVHKYIEQIYRACAVSSRAELMARCMTRRRPGDR